MGLRTRLALLILSLIAAFAALTVVVILSLARSSMYDATDTVIEGQSVPLIDRPIPVGIETLLEDLEPLDEMPDFGDSVVRVQLFQPDGELLLGDADIPIDTSVIDAATSDPSFRSTIIDGIEFRVMTMRRSDGRVIQSATTSEPIAQGLRELRRNAIALAAIATVAAAGMGWLVAGRFTRPIVEVADATPQLASPHQLPAPIESNRTDEIGTLVANFNGLINALRESNDRQERLVADASHELRTPLTSLRMKIDFLDSQPDLHSDQRADILRGAALELESLSELVTELVTLARRDLPEDPLCTIELDTLVAEVVDRSQRSSGRSIVLDASPTRLEGREAMIRRAVGNLIDNALKFSPDDTEVTVRVSDGQVEVEDQGPGFSEPDRHRAFERFYRSRAVHDVPGSGIGLAIVQQVADDHGGEVWIDDAPDGGARVGMALSTTDS